MACGQHGGGGNRGAGPRLQYPAHRSSILEQASPRQPGRSTRVLVTTVKSSMKLWHSLRNINSNLRDALQDIRAQSAGSHHEASESTAWHSSISQNSAQPLPKSCFSLSTVSDLDHVKRKRDALRAAFKLAWKRERIGDLESRVNGFRSQLNLSLLVSIRLAIRQSFSTHLDHSS